MSHVTIVVIVGLTIIVRPTSDCAQGTSAIECIRTWVPILLEHCATNSVETCSAT